MHLFLANKHLIFVTDYFGLTSAKVYHIPVNPWVPQNEFYAEKLHHIRKALNKMRKSANDWSLAVTLGWKDELAPTLDITVEGDEVINAIGDLIYGGDKTRALDIIVTLGITYQGYTFGIPKSVKIVKMLNMVPTEGGSRRYENLNGWLPPALHNRNNIMRKWFELSISVDTTQYVPLNDYQSLTPSVNQKLLENGNLSDFQIIAADGSSFPCHKIFLHAQSDVLAAMLEGKFKEAQENKMRMEDMPADGVKSLLAFLYCGDLHGAVKDCKVALSLFVAADKYNIQNLEKAMSDLLHGKSDQWYDLETAFKLYQFLMNYQGKYKDKLILKMLGILGRKYDELASSNLFEEFPNTGVLKDMFLQSIKHFSGAFRLS